MAYGNNSIIAEAFTNILFKFLPSTLFAYVLSTLEQTPCTCHLPLPNCLSLCMKFYASNHFIRNLPLFSVAFSGICLFLFLTVLLSEYYFFLEQLETAESRKVNSPCLSLAKAFWKLLIAPWRLLFAFVPPYQIAHGWIAFLFSLAFIAGIAYAVTKLTDLISCVTGLYLYIHVSLRNPIVFLC